MVSPDYDTRHIRLSYRRSFINHFEEYAMIQLKDKETGRSLGSITEDDLQFLIDQLEEESLEDKDYYLHRVTLDALKEKGASQPLVELLEKALGDRDDMEFEWSKA
jgi:hypothetical protein